VRTLNLRRDAGVSRRGRLRRCVPCRDRRFRACRRSSVRHSRLAAIETNPPPEAARTILIGFHQVKKPHLVLTR
jgi:hypothetical protein